MIEQKQFSVGATKYKLTQFGARRGQQILLRVAKVLAPAVKDAAEHGGEIELGHAVSALIEALDQSVMDEVCDAFAGECLVSTDGGKTWPCLRDCYDDHFAGAYKAWAEWVKGCFEVNYADFFGGVAGKLRKTTQEATTEKTAAS